MILIRWAAVTIIQAWGALDTLIVERGCSHKTDLRDSPTAGAEPEDSRVESETNDVPQTRDCMVHSAPLVDDCAPTNCRLKRWTVIGTDDSFQMTINQPFSTTPNPSAAPSFSAIPFAAKVRTVPQGYLVGYFLLLTLSVLFSARYAVALVKTLSHPDAAVSSVRQPHETTLAEALTNISALDKSVGSLPVKVAKVPPTPVQEDLAPEAQSASGEIDGAEIVAPSNAAHSSRSETAATPIRHPAPLHEQMVTPGNFTYLGGFRPPHVSGVKSNFTYGGWALAWDSHGDPTGADDGYPGSLYVVGHPNEEMVAEISIPQPVISKASTLDELSVAEVLQPFGDITGGIRDEMTRGSSEPFRIGGMHVIGDRLHWTLHKYYNVETIDYSSHGVSSLSTTVPRPEGMWHLGPSQTGRSEWHSYKHAGYIFEMPEEFAARWFGGRNLISGLQIATGLNIASHGPAMFAYQLPPSGTQDGTSLDAIPLVYNDIHRPSPDFHPADRWTGGAWLTVGDRDAVIITGRKALGEVYYGEARPFDCSIDKGYHGAPYESQILFYAPQALIAAAHGSMDPTQITPWYVWNQTSPGGGLAQYLFPSCNQHLGGLAFDRINHLLYLVQINAGTTSDDVYGVLPVIHVFRIDQGP